jgi:hypothetical protein
VRTAQPFANLAVGVSSFNLPKRPQSWRLVNLRGNFVFGALTAQVAIALLDGAANVLATWSTDTLPGGLSPANVSWSGGQVGQPNYPASGLAAALVNVGISDDLWVQPNWTIQVTINPNNAADQITALCAEIEEYSKKSGQVDREPQP